MGWEAIAAAVVPSIIGAVAGSGGDSATQTQTTSNIPEYAKGDIQTMWTDYMNRMYPKTKYTTTATPGGGAVGGSNLYNEWQTLKAQSTNPERDRSSQYDGIPIVWFQSHASPELREFMKKNNLTSMSDDSSFQAAMSSDPSVGGSTTTANTPLSYEQMLANDLLERKTATEKYNTGVTDLNAGTLAKTKAAVSPYTTLLNKYVEEGNAGTGLFKPVNFGFGGKHMARIVPKSNRNLATQLAGFGQDASSANMNLINLENTFGNTDLSNILNAAKTYTKNAADTSYMEKLQALILPLTGQGSTSTATRNTGGDVLSGLLSGALAGSNIYGNIMKYNKNPTSKV